MGGKGNQKENQLLGVPKKDHSTNSVSKWKTPQNGGVSSCQTNLKGVPYKIPAKWFCLNLGTPFRSVESKGSRALSFHAVPSQAPRKVACCACSGPPKVALGDVCGLGPSPGLHHLETGNVDGQRMMS